MPERARPTPADLRAAADNTLTDILAPGLRVLFCGINPGLYSAYTGHHFARPGNRFWPTLHAAGFTPRRLLPEEDRSLLDYGYGLTNVVERASASADELSPAELAEGGRRLAAKVEQYRPRFLALLSIGAYRSAFGRPKATVGRQEERLHGAALWVLPSPSGLNAHYRPADLARLYAELRAAAEGQR